MSWLLLHHTRHNVMERRSSEGSSYARARVGVASSSELLWLIQNDRRTDGGRAGGALKLRAVRLSSPPLPRTRGASRWSSQAPIRSPLLASAGPRDIIWLKTAVAPATHALSRPRPPSGSGEKQSPKSIRGARASNKGGRTQPYSDLKGTPVGHSGLRRPLDRRRGL